MQELSFYVDIYDESRGRVVRFNILKDIEEKNLGTVKYFVEEENLNSYNNSYNYSKSGVADTFHQQCSGSQGILTLVISENNLKNIGGLHNQVMNNILYCPEYLSSTKY